ncbi:MAG: SpaA isopeptide-forming pilin-related protein [Methanothrix sp.]
MRKVLAITAALMIAAIIMPALGYSNEAAGNQSYSITSGERIAYTLTSGDPAHSMTPGMVEDKYSLEAPAVSSTKVPYSFNAGAAPKYSFALIGVENAAAQGIKTDKAPALLGSMNKKETTATATEAVAATEATTATETPAGTETTTMTEAANVAENTTPAEATTVTEAATEAAALVNETENATVVEPAAELFAIEGAVMDNNQTALANWTMNLSMNGAAVSSVVTGVDGKFAFADLAAGAYTVSEMPVEGWAAVSPAEGAIEVTLTNASVTDLVFINQPI